MAARIAERILNRPLLGYGPGLVIVHVGASGIDRSFAEACGDIGVAHETDPACWEAPDHPEALIRYRANHQAYDANAGHIRNQAMV
jgi:hypothetical protein